MDLPKGCEIETARYASEHRREILDRIREDLTRADPILLEDGIPINGMLILSHRHPISRQIAVLLSQNLKDQADYFIEGQVGDE